MPTYAQLQAEPWWGREIVTAELDWLGAELCRRTRRPRDAFGVKGDNNHLRGAHRSQEWILKSRYATSRTYTVQSGLTATQARHIAGVDFTPGSVNQMVAQCKRIYAAMRAGRLDEVREFYGNVDGDRIVDGWDNVRDRAASSDSSHLWHWHLTLDRRRCADRALMERILAIALGDTVEEDMSVNDPVNLIPVPGVGYSGNDKTRTVGQLLAGTYGYVLQSRNQLVADLTEVKANVAALAGKDWVNEQQIVDGVLAGLGSKDLDDVVTALRAAFGDRAAELGAKLAAPESRAGE